MGGAGEKRQYERHEHRAPIIYAHQDSDIFFDADMCNYSSGGMCFKTVQAVQKGSEIYIMMEDFAPDDIGAEIYDGKLAEVRWCRSVSRPKPDCFLVGVRYY